MKNNTPFNDALITTLKDIVYKYPEKWEASSSQDCFILFLDPDAFTICNYLNGDNSRSFAIATIDTFGSIRNEITVNEKETEDLYSSVFDIYKNIKDQVEINKLNNINIKFKNELAPQEVSSNYRN